MHGGVKREWGIWGSRTQKMRSLMRKITKERQNGCSCLQRFIKIVYHKRNASHMKYYYDDDDDHSRQWRPRLPQKKGALFWNSYSSVLLICVMWYCYQQSPQLIQTILSANQHLPCSLVSFNFHPFLLMLTFPYQIDLSASLPAICNGPIYSLWHQT